MTKKQKTKTECQPIQPAKQLTAMQFGCPGQPVNCNCRAHIPIVHFLYPHMFLNVTWHARVRAYQITPHSAHNTPRASSTEMERYFVYFHGVDRLYVFQETEGGKDGKQPGGMKVKKKKEV